MGGGGGGGGGGGVNDWDMPLINLAFVCLLLLLFWFSLLFFLFCFVFLFICFLGFCLFVCLFLFFGEEIFVLIYRDILFLAAEKLRMRRSSILEPYKGTTDVRDEVYKFLQRKFSTSELRRMSLSSVEGQLHSGTTLDDITGRRSSFSQSGQSQHSSSRRGSTTAQQHFPSAKNNRFIEQSAVNEVRKLTTAMENVRGSSLRRPNTTETTPSNISRASPSINSKGSLPFDSNFKTESTTQKPGRSYSWAPDVTSTQDWHILALELLARNRQGVAKFHTVRGLLKGLADEYRKQTTSMMYEELRYCTYLRLPKRLLPPDLSDCDVSSIFEHPL